LCRRDNCRLCFTDHVNAVVIAHSFFAGADEPLRFICPKNEQVIAAALLGGFIEPP